MSDLKFREKNKLEDQLEMRGGYVADFINDTFQEFVLEVTGKDIFDERYNHRSGSKANRLRKFWEVEPNQIVGKLLHELLQYQYDQMPNEIEESAYTLYSDCVEIANRLQASGGFVNQEVVKPFTAGKTNYQLVESIIEDLKNDKPEKVLDRLHTFAMSYFRELCNRVDVIYVGKDRLQKIAKMYFEALTKSAGFVESEMSGVIFKSFNSLLDQFDHVRNNRSLAHDNELLNYEESVLICECILSVVKFTDSLELKRQKRLQQEKQKQYDADLPF